MTETKSSTGPVKWYYTPTGALLLIFLALGPFGLPLVYRSPRFNRTARILITAAMVPYTWFIVVSTVAAVRKALEIMSVVMPM